MRRAFFGVTALASAISLAVLGDLSHYSWWSIIVLWAYSIAAVSGIAGAVAHFVVTVQYLVVGGVILMSAMGCGVLLEVATESPWEYVIGTYVMHYAPLAITLCDWRFPCKPKLALVQSASAVAIFALYSAIATPMEVYRCNVEVWQSLLAASFFPPGYYVFWRLLDAR